MSKIICDVCGTSYPENANQCPICGCVRSVEAKTVSGSTDNAVPEVVSSYTYVKGGRFSKKNVRKRNLERVSSEQDKPAAEPAPEEKPKKQDKGLVVAVIVLLLAIVAVFVYIAVRFLIPGAQSGVPDNIDGTIITTAPTTESTSLVISCEKLILSDTVVELKTAGAIQLLSVKTEPADTTDTVIFASEDENIAKVNEDGKIEAVGPGQTTITITCGEQTETCRITCTFEAENTTAPTEETTVPVYDPSELKLLKSDVTLSKKAEVWVAYRGKIPAGDITWTSDNEKVATVQDGKVTAVGKGNTTIHGEYGGVKVSCIIRCSASVGAYVEQEEATQPTQSSRKYHLNTDNNSQKNDITLKIGESFTFKLRDSEGNEVAAEFSCSNVQVCSLSGAEVTGLAVGTTNLVAEYEGETHICTVRVSNS
ncbi:MAG: Ig-like domain-containing protein [Oscillospiraceae bacterium]|nr:Ig-like domain-containing protein [Oscillospiraceae bacterium]